MTRLLALFRHVTKACHYRVRCVAGNVVLRVRSRRQTGRATDPHDLPVYDPTNPLHRRAFRQFENQRRSHEAARRNNARREAALRGAEAFLADDLDRTAKRAEAVARAKSRHPSNTDDNARASDPDAYDDAPDYYGTYPWSVN